MDILLPECVRLRELRLYFVFTVTHSGLEEPPLQQIDFKTLRVVKQFSYRGGASIFDGKKFKYIEQILNIFVIMCHQVLVTFELKGSQSYN